MSTSSGKQDPNLGRCFEAAKAIVHAVKFLYFAAEAARRGNQFLERIFEKISDETADVLPEIVPRLFENVRTVESIPSKTKEVLRKAGPGESKVCGVLGLSVHDAVARMGATILGGAGVSSSEESHLSNVDLNSSTALAGAIQKTDWLLGRQPDSLSQLEAALVRLEGEYLNACEEVQPPLVSVPTQHTSDPDVRIEGASQESAGNTTPSGAVAEEDMVWFFATDAANYIGVHESTIRRWIRDDMLSVVAQDRTKYRFRISELRVHREARAKPKSRLKGPE